ncbi:MAG: bifunctional diaminohydroxyphosphoribosylaminopyrimidine deaminase/5-amino-6-(5-phosphoribosylamino)uracil reductase RibD [Oligoflexales bacterium]|nr:bifunctional diaminohydroxyphosphoribosylaminopyrimidine deaminase/5-amino-6-(5-phosphoribosylamino)uracil reductase RibD [Oligoflexales bacterium]
MEWIPICDDEIFVNSLKIIPDVGAQISSRECMELAYAFALQGAGHVASNPMVGAVVVDKEHRFLGAAAHLKFGEAHAEASLIESLEKQGLIPRLNGATFYCTLEPCSFQGKTPSCAKLLSRFPIKNLVYGRKDPNKRVDGKGLKILESAGIQCLEDAWFSKQSVRLIRSFSWCMRNAQPYVGLKVGMSFDGKVGKENSERFWITGDRAREYGHWLRHLYDGILVGADTVIVDNPSLNLRHPHVKTASCTTKVVLDPGGRAYRSRPVSSQRLVSSKNSGDRIFWVVKKGLHQEMLAEMEQQFGESGVVLLQLDSDGQGIDLQALLRALYKHGVTSLLLEGGRYVWASFLNQKLVQRIHAFQASQIFGESATLKWDAGLMPMEGTQLVEKSISPLGPDWIVEADIKYSEEDS